VKIPGFGEISEGLRRSTVQIRDSRQARGIGSGVVFSAGGTILTNAHVASGEQARVELWDGRELPARITSRDPGRDLAFLQVSATGLPVATFGDSSRLRVGELVIAIGNPLGFAGALTTGVVHAVGPLPGLGRRKWVQANVRLAPGNSGGPLADAEGRVVGINTMIAGGLALAVPSNTVAEFHQKGPRTARLGVVLRPVPVRFDGHERLGLMLLEVLAQSPAAACSLLPGDILLGSDGRWFTGPEDLADWLDEAGATIRLMFLRGDRSRLRETTAALARAAEAA
jgi:serine protease Do